MIFCKYTKLDTAVFTPHLDLLRSVGMGIRRKKLSINYSEGFNPHALLFFNQPLPVGVASECEYFCADSKESAVDFLNELNTSLPNGIKILKSANLEKNPNIAKLMNSAKYKITLNENIDLKDAIDMVLKSTEFEITFKQKGKETTKEVRGMIFDIYKENNDYYFILACGNINLRADRLMQNLLNSKGESCDFDVLKQELYDKDGKNIDDLFFI